MLGRKFPFYFSFVALVLIEQIYFESWVNKSIYGEAKVNSPKVARVGDAIDLLCVCMLMCCYM